MRRAYTTQSSGAEITRVASGFNSLCAVALLCRFKRMHKEQILPYNCNDKRQPENIDMDLTQLIILLLLGILRNLSVTGE